MINRRQVLKWAPTVLIIAVVILVVTSLAYSGATGSLPEWTGFGPPRINDDTGLQQPQGKTLWDWLQLLVVPFAIAVAGYLVQRQQSRSLAKREEARIAKAESQVDAQPQKAKPAWDLARVTLEAYFSRNISQITSIFWLSVFVLLVGFIIIGWGVLQSIQAPDTIAPAVIATAAGIITEFIGATFLLIYRSSVEQAVNYSKTLERINSVGMAMQILDTIPDSTKPDDLKSQTKAKLVEQLVKQAHGVQDTDTMKSKEDTKK